MIPLVEGISMMHDLAAWYAAEANAYLLEGNLIEASDNFGTANGLLKAIGIMEQVKSAMAANN